MNRSISGLSVPSLRSFITTRAGCSHHRVSLEQVLSLVLEYMGVRGYREGENAMYYISSSVVDGRSYDSETILFPSFPRSHIERHSDLSYLFPHFQPRIDPDLTFEGSIM